MSILSELLAVMKGTPELEGDWLADAIGENTYRLSHDGRKLFAKWIPADDQRGHNEIAINRAYLERTSLPVPRLLYVLPSPGSALVAIWDWLEGGDLRQANRDSLAIAFNNLGLFHAEQRNRMPVSSPISGRTYTTVESFVRWESKYLCTSLASAEKNACGEILRGLLWGYPTLIHGDMHPGNICNTPAGPVLVDWGYARRSINLLDLDYVRSIKILPEETEWWIIQPEEGNDVLAAYFPACGLPEVNIPVVHMAVMVWTELWGLRNAEHSHDVEAIDRSHQRLCSLLETHL